MDELVGPTLTHADSADRNRSTNSFAKPRERSALTRFLLLAILLRNGLAEIGHCTSACYHAS